jgi:hypothetical protein
MLKGRIIFSISRDASGLTQERRKGHRRCITRCTGRQDAQLFVGAHYRRGSVLDCYSIISTRQGEEWNDRCRRNGVEDA